MQTFSTPFGIAGGGLMGCSAAAAGSMFVYQSQQRGVLISYPSQSELRDKVYKRLP